MVLSRVSLIAIAATGCGRFGFDPRTDAASDSAGDTQPLDGAAVSGPRWNLTFENAFVDVAEARSVFCPANCPTFSPGRAGGFAGRFDGNECLFVADDAALHVQVFTLAAWIQVAASGTSATLLGKPYNGATTGENSWELWLNSSTGLRFDTTPSVSISGGNLPENVWHHVAATYESGQTAIYVDGAVQQTGTSVATSYATDPIRIGCDLDLGVVDSFFKGDLDDVRFYDRALSADEIATLAQ